MEYFFEMHVSNTVEESTFIHRRWSLRSSAYFLQTSNQGNRTDQGGSIKGEPEGTVGAAETSGELVVLVKWKHCNDADIVPECLIIRFFAERLAWHVANNEESVEIEESTKKR